MFTRAFRLPQVVNAALESRYQEVSEDSEVGINTLLDTHSADRAPLPKSARRAMMAAMVFDGHNDLVSRIYTDPEVDFFSGHKSMHLSLEAVRAGGLFGGLFAMFVPPTGEARFTKPYPKVGLETARRAITAQFAILLRLVERSDGKLVVTRSVTEIEAARDRGAIAVVPHLEGADAISAGLDELEVWHAAGLRSIGPVWSRPNRFGHGVPINREGTPDTGGGLTAAGKRLVRRCNELGILIDASHMTERAFRDLARVSEAPLVASHSNAWELCRSSRNVTDPQVQMIAERGGLIGLNFGTLFLRADGEPNQDTPIARMVEHVKHLVDRAGVEHVGLGSDFDGAPISKEIGDAAGVPRLLEALRRAGFTDTEVEAIAWKNWLRVLRASWRE